MLEFLSTSCSLEFKKEDNVDCNNLVKIMCIWIIDCVLTVEELLTI